MLQQRLTSRWAFARGMRRSISHSKLRRSCFKPSRPAARHACLSGSPPVGRHLGFPVQGLGLHHCMARLQAPLKVRAQPAAAAQREAHEGDAPGVEGGSTWEEEGAQVGPSRAHEAREHAEGGLLGQVHQDDARHKRHSLAVRHLPTPSFRLACKACSACLALRSLLCRQTASHVT